MYISAKYACLCDALLGVCAFPFRGLLVAVLRGEVGDHKVAGVDTGDIAVIASLKDIVGLIIAELTEPAERLMVVDMTTGGQNVVGRIVEQHQLGVIDTVG